MSVEIHLQPTTLVGRGYGDGDSFEARSPYQTVFSVFMPGDGTAFIYAMHGEFSFRILVAIARRLRDEYAIRTVSAERHGKRVDFDVATVAARG